MRANPQAPSREGILLGLIAGTATWLWVAGIDLVLGRPFHTFNLLGGVAGFTLVHYALNIAYGVAVVGVATAARRAPSVIIGAIFVFIILEVAFGMVSAILSQTGAGLQSWLQILGGSLIGATIMLAMVGRRHELLTRLHEAESER